MNKLTKLITDTLPYDTSGVAVGNNVASGDGFDVGFTSVFLTGVYL